MAETKLSMSSSTEEIEAQAEPDIAVKDSKDSSDSEEQEETSTAAAAAATAEPKDDDSIDKKEHPEAVVVAASPTPTKPSKASSLTPKSASNMSPTRKGSQVPGTSSGERTNIRQRLIDVVKASPVEMNRSSELVPLTQKYEENRKHLKNLHAAAKAYQQGLHDLHDKRIEMMKHLSLIAADTPLFDAIGKHKNNKEEEDDNMPPSLEARVRQCAAESEMQSKQFDATFLDYVLEWDRVTSERISAELKEAGSLKSTRSHYESKVEKLRKESRDLEEKGKKMKKSHQEKLERNEEKLSKAYDEHEAYCGHLCVLIEQASTKIGRWRDLLPLAKNYMQWEVERCESEANTLGTLGEVIEMMEAEAREMDAPPAAKAL